eukprot:CAMPEP_0114592752 /NCGR_PEP_ID=MMETSP0125-20121206/14500_1 /TAXON_ID=485358 ORGANISM="Aristerostoma sp., Strain ATCC 50986" /NCGR_SAMPLE_ID=MMETSP0125 /ASSEMBLY_ACC=CAM_ASM_000245 /LENGTH=204 /DNA_ID=CAMNT_0001791553 /DNA_START=93 /DNA_END=707 /DNA_ORIENTATION=-
MENADFSTKFIYKEKRQLTSYSEQLNNNYKPRKDRFQKPEGLNKNYMRMFTDEIKSSREGSQAGSASKRSHRHPDFDNMSSSFSSNDTSPRGSFMSPSGRKSQFFNNKKPASSFAVLASKKIGSSPKSKESKQAEKSKINISNIAKAEQIRHPILVNSEEVPSTKHTIVTLLSPKTPGNNANNLTKDTSGATSPVISPKSAQFR